MSPEPDTESIRDGLLERIRERLEEVRAHNSNDDDEMIELPDPGGLSAYKPDTDGYEISWGGPTYGKSRLDAPKPDTLEMECLRCGETGEWVAVERDFSSRTTTARCSSCNHKQLIQFTAAGRRVTSPPPHPSSHPEFDLKFVPDDESPSGDEAPGEAAEKFECSGCGEEAYVLDDDVIEEGNERYCSIRCLNETMNP